MNVSKSIARGSLAELHTHLGGSVASDILWSLAHEQGIALPVKDFWEFDRLVTVSDPRGVENLEARRQVQRRQVHELGEGLPDLGGDAHRLDEAGTAVDDPMDDRLGRRLPSRREVREDLLHRRLEPRPRHRLCRRLAAPALEDVADG